MKVCKKITTEKIIQILLCALLPIIDLYRVSGNSEHTMITTQAIGFVVVGTLILHYKIKSFLKWYNIIWLMLCICGICSINLIYAKLTSALFYQRECWLICINICLYGMVFTHLIIMSIKDKIKIAEKVQAILCVKNLFLLFWFIYAVLASCSKEWIYRPGIELAYFLPLFLVPFEEKDYRNLYQDFSCGVLLSFWGIQFVAFLRRPWLDFFLRYRGMYTNSNHFDSICLFVLVLLLLKMTETRRLHSTKCWKYWFWIVQFGVVFSLIILSIGRMPLILAVIITVIYGITIKLIDSIKIKRFMQKVLLFIVVACITFPITYVSVRYIPRIINRPYIYDVEYGSVGDLHANDNYVSIKEFSTEFSSRLATIIWDYSEVHKEEADEERVYVYEPGWENKTYFIDYKNYNSVELRIAIGLTFMSHLNMRGHTTDEWLLWVSPIEQYIHAHNIFIMIAYIYGIPAGIFFMLWIVSLVVASIRGLISNRKENYLLFAFIIMFVIVGYGCYEMNWQPGQIHWFTLFFVTRILLRTEEKGLNTENDNSYNIKKQ